VQKYHANVKQIITTVLSVYSSQLVYQQIHELLIMYRQSNATYI